MNFIQNSVNSIIGLPGTLVVDSINKNSSLRSSISSSSLSIDSSERKKLYSKALKKHIDDYSGSIQNDLGLHILLKVFGIHEKYILIKKDKSIDIKDTKKRKAKVVIPFINPSEKDYAKFGDGKGKKKEIELNLEHYSRLSSYIESWDEDMLTFYKDQKKSMELINQ